MATRHGVFADDSATLCVVVPKDVKRRISLRGKPSEIVRKYIVDGLAKDERKNEDGKKE